MKTYQFVLILFIFILFQIIIFQNSEIKQMKSNEQISQKMKQIDQDQIRDLIYQISTIKQENQSTATTNYVAGVIDAISKKDHYYEIWHNGFDKGFENKKLIDEVMSTEKFVEKK